MPAKSPAVRTARLQRIIRAVTSAIASQKFFYVVLVLLIFQALWIALSAQYPLAFDENFHYELIKLYSHQWSPFFSANPEGAGALGDLTRNPSYLYHYLMSFPYRFITLFTHNEVHQIIILRLMNITLFSFGLAAFQRLLIKLKISRQLTNFALLVLITVPVVPFLAAHINYDNLLFLLVPVILSLAVTCGRGIWQSHHLPIVPFALLLIMSLLACLVKYVFLPILLAIALYLIVLFLLEPHKKALLKDIPSTFWQLGRGVKIALIVGLLLAGGLFTERYIGNVVQYRSFSPACETIENSAYCSQNGSWSRNVLLAQKAKDLTVKPNANPFVFFEEWTHDLLYRLYFAINYDYSTKPPLLIPYRAVAAVGLLGLLFLCFWGYSILKRYKSLLLPLAVVIVYVSALFYTNYTDYLKYGERVAINGRYFIPLLPFVFVFIGLAYDRFFALLKPALSSYLKIGFVVLACLIILQGGGLLTFLAESEPNWYWQDKTVIAVNQVAQKIVTSFILGLHD